VKTVKDLMSKEPATIESDKTVTDAAKLMAQKGVGCLMVSTKGKIVGIITERDFVSRVLAESFEPSKVRVSDVMTTPLFTVSSEDSINEAADMMIKYKIRRLPVVDAGVLKGIVTASDLAKSLSVPSENESIVKALSAHAEPSPYGPYG
jgi:CBS domain-containing protein